MTPAGHTLAGTLTLPKGASRTRPVSAIVTITGSGPQDRDENIGLPGFLPFRQIADSLARRGIAVLRMDDRGTGHRVVRSRARPAPTLPRTRVPVLPICARGPRSGPTASACSATARVR